MAVHTATLLLFLLLPAVLACIQGTPSPTQPSSAAPGRGAVTSREPNPARETCFSEICLNLADATQRKWLTQRKGVHPQICLLLILRLLR